MPPNTIIPNYKLLLTYDIRPESLDKYYYYVLREFVPELENMGLYMFRVWHVAYGDYPVRQMEFVTEDLETAQEVFQSERWCVLEDRLKSYTMRYGRKLVKFRVGFQF
jgi:hypothetical protein